MKIEIDIDLESIVIEALKKKEIADIYVPPIEVEIPSSYPPSISDIKNSTSKWEYGRRPGKRRTAEEVELHRLEKEKGEALTPEEKGEARAKIQMDETAENNAKDAAIKKARIENIAAEGMAAASKELAEEIKERDNDITRVQEGMDKHDIENEIPKAESINTPNSLFS
jgi:hypothetical protein